MRKFRKILTMLSMVAISGAVFTACSDDDDNEVKNRLSVDPPSKTIAFDFIDPIQVVVDTDASSFDAKEREQDDWVKVTKNSDGKSFTVEAEKNDTQEERTAIVTVTAGNADSKTFTLTQRAEGQTGGGNTLTIRPETLTIEADNTDVITVEVETDADEFDAQERTQDDWITVDLTEEGFTVTPTANDTYEERTAIVTVTAGDADAKTFTLTQSAKEYPYYINFINEDGEEIESYDIDFSAHNRGMIADTRVIIEIKTNLEDIEIAGLTVKDEEGNDIEWVVDPEIVADFNNGAIINPISYDYALVFSTTTNDEEDPRTAIFSITGEDLKPVSLTVTQETAPYFNTSSMWLFEYTDGNGNRVEDLMSGFNEIEYYELEYDGVYRTFALDDQGLRSGRIYVDEEGEIFIPNAMEIETGYPAGVESIIYQYIYLYNDGLSIDGFQLENVDMVPATIIDNNTFEFPSEYTLDGSTYKVALVIIGVAVEDQARTALVQATDFSEFTRLTF